MKQTPHLFTIPPTAPFLEILAARLLDGTLIADFSPGSDPLALASATIYLPTRRAARTLREIFRRAYGGEVALLPRIRPLGGIDESEMVLRGGADLEPLLPAMGEIDRRLAMTRLILAWAGHVRREVLTLGPDEPFAVPASPADAAWLATDLLSLMDQIETEEADWQAIQTLAPGDYSRYWQITLDFLKIATQAWPAHLQERGRMDPNTRRSTLLRREAERLAADPPEGPVIVAGSTGSVPATADLIKVVAHMRRGAVVLPGLDKDLDATVWRDLAGAAASPGHPQYGLRRLLAHLGVERGEVADLAAPGSPQLADRSRIVAEALRPAETTDAWRAFLRDPVARRADSAFANVALITARNEAEEALALALILREAVETGAEAALVTPDRSLARRVCGELRRWDLNVEDSAGQPLDRSPPATLARLVAGAALDGLEPVILLALLKHPLARFGLTAAGVRGAARVLERAVLRGPRARHGTQGLIDALDAAEVELAGATHVPRWRRLAPADWAAARDLVDRLARALRPLEDLLDGRGLVPAERLAECHVASLRAVAADETGSDFALFAGEAGAALAQVLTGIVEAEGTGLALPPADWPAVFDALMSGVQVHGRAPVEPRIHVWGPLEARLHRPDLLVLAGLNEGSWPATTRNDPWLNRPMKRDVGLEAPERRIGQAAHDFAQGLGADRVILSRAARAGTAPTVASRWLQRLLTVVGKQVADAMAERGRRYTDWARALDSGDRGRPAQRPNPRPPVAARPRRLSVTAVETWIRDPYAIFAREILALDPLDPLGGVPGAADRGTLIHDTLAEFVETWSGPFDDSARARLESIGRERFSKLQAFPEIHALWWPRFLRVAAWFIGFEARRAAEITARQAEVRGRIEISGPAGPFILSGRADRIDARVDGSFGLLDYKTGTPPSAKEVASLLAPQLPLEAAMLARGGFADIAAGAVSELAYIQLSGGTTPGRYAPCNHKGVDLGDLTEDAYARLAALVAAYDSETQGYLSRARPKFESRFDGPYDHVARVREWSLGDGEDA